MARMALPFSTGEKTEEEKLDELDDLMSQLFASSSSSTRHHPQPSTSSISSADIPVDLPPPISRKGSSSSRPSSSSHRPRTTSSSSTSNGKRPRSRSIPSAPLIGRRDSRGSINSRRAPSRRGSAISIHSMTTAQGLPGMAPSSSEWTAFNSETEEAGLHLQHPEEDELDDSDDDDPLDFLHESPRTPLRTSSLREPFGSSPRRPALRLVPRSARNERTLVAGDLDFLRDPVASPTLTEDGLDWQKGANMSPGMGGGSDRASIHSRSSKQGSARSLRLRQDIEKAARELRARSSSEAVNSANAGERASLHSRASDQSLLRSALSGGSSSQNRGGSLDLGPRSPLEEEGETQSIMSATSATSNSLGSPFSPGSEQVFSMPFGSDAGSLETNSVGEKASTLAAAPGVKEKESRKGEREVFGRPRQKELKEWSQSCWVWQKDKSGSGGMLSKTPLIREVPAVMKRKMGGKRDSSIVSADSLAFDENAGAGASSSIKSGKSALREKSSKSTFGVGPNSTTKDASWRKVVGVLRDDGYFRVFNEDSVILHSIHIPSIPRTDVRQVDQSLFNRPNVVVIHRRGISPLTPVVSSASMSFSKSQGPSASTSSLRTTQEEPLYLCMPSVVAMQSWIVMAHCFARPEFLTTSPILGGVSPRPGVGTKDSTSWATDTEEEEDEHSNAWEEVDLRCRIFRSIFISINEGKSIGEVGTDTMRGPKNGLDRRADIDKDSQSFGTETTTSLGSELSPSKSSMNGSVRPSFRENTHSSASDVGQALDTFCEISIEGDVLARTSVRKSTSSPFWNESFTFTDLPPIIHPLTIKIFQTHKTSRPSLLGTAIVRIPDHPRAELLEDWWPVRPVAYDARGGRQTETIGQLSLSVKVDEEVVLPSSEYSTILQMLSDDADADLAKDLTQEFPNDLEEMSKLLLRIYQAESLLIPRILRLAELEIDGDLRSAAILFRGNSVLTKSIELYLRLIGTEYLDHSIGDSIRKLCAAKVEIEIDPSKMKLGVKEKEMANNVHELQEWVTVVWNAIYDARERCPDEIRQIFAHIQKIVTAKYGEEQKKMRSTSISAFIFLRFFVPAVLNPKLFNLVSVSPDSKSQRTLTLIAKTLQGLANFSTFGQKEPWMGVMNNFVQDNTSGFVDFIHHISTPSTNARYEWTSPHSSIYMAPYRLRNALPQHVREGVPLLPHLLDLPRDLGLLASHVARAMADRERNYRPVPTRNGSNESSAISISSRASRSAKFEEFSERCVDAHDEARKRGGGLLSAPLTVKKDRSSLRALPRGATAHTSAWTRNMDEFDPPRTPPRRRKRLDGSDEETDEDMLSIRAQALGPSPSSTASRRTHRSFTVSGIPVRPSLSQELSVDDVLDIHSAPVSDVFVMRRPAPASLDELSIPGEDDEEKPPPSPQPGYVFPSRPPTFRSVPVQIVQSTTTTVTRTDNAEELADDEQDESDAAPYSSVPMATQLSSSTQGSSYSQTDGSTISNASTVSIAGEVSVAHVVEAGRRPSKVGMMGMFMAEDPYGEGKGRKNFLSRMARKNSRAGV